MSDSTGVQVECPICGVAFDPTAAGGWCTNAECGEWQYIGEEVPEPAEMPPADASDLDSDDEAAESGDHVAQADDAADGGDEDASAPDEDASAPDEDASAPDDDGAQAGDETAGDGDEATDAANGSDDEAGELTADADATCPDCGTAVDPSANFCAQCGADLEPAGESALEACPTCGSDVDEDDRFCANCGEDLEAATGGRESPEVDEGTDVDEEADAGDEDTDAAVPAPKSLVLRARGKEIAVTDDDTVGREARRIVTETDGDEDAAIRIHREHLRFVREDGRFYLVDLGDNPTALNGRRLSKGDREPVEPGDEIELSGVLTLSVHRP